MNKEKRVTILKRLYKNNFHSEIGLNFSSSFELLIAVLLSSRTANISVNRVTEKLFLVANTPQAMLDLGVEEIKSFIKTIGLFNRKAENIIKTCRILIEKHGGAIPENRALLEDLPGVGRKTANIVLNVKFGWPTIAVDTHVFRVCNRTNFASGKNVKQVEERLLKLVPKKFKAICHHCLILHGRNICIARKPRCGHCIIKDLCEFEEKFFN